MNTKSSATSLRQELIWKVAPDRAIALKLLNEQTGGTAMAFEETTPAGTETPLHLHRDSDEVMFVLSGQFSFKVGDEFGTGGPGSCVFMPRGVPHAWKNSGNEIGRAFFMYTPGRAGVAFEDAQRMQQSRASTSDAELLEVFQRYGFEMVGPPPFDE